MAKMMKSRTSWEKEEDMISSWESGTAVLGKTAKREKRDKYVWSRSRGGKWVICRRVWITKTFEGQYNLWRCVMASLLGCLLVMLVWLCFWEGTKVAFISTEFGCFVLCNFHCLCHSLRVFGLIDPIHPRVFSLVGDGCEICSEIWSWRVDSRFW